MAIQLNPKAWGSDWGSTLLDRRTSRTPHDDEWGETVAAAIVLETDATATAEELQDWIRARLRSSRSPTVIQFRTDLPYNETGRLLRRGSYGPS